RISSSVSGGMAPTGNRLRGPADECVPGRDVARTRAGVASTQPTGSAWSPPWRHSQRTTVWAGSLAAEIAVADAHLPIGHVAQAISEGKRHRHRTVLAPRAADGDRRVALVLALVALEDRPDRGDVRVEELGCAFLREHDVAHLAGLTREAAQVLVPERVRQEAHVGDQIGVDRQAALEAEAEDRRAVTRRTVVVEQSGDAARELVHVEVRGVDRDVAA